MSILRPVSELGINLHVLSTGLSVSRVPKTCAYYVVVDSKKGDSVPVEDVLYEADAMTEKVAGAIVVEFRDFDGLTREDVMIVIDVLSCYAPVCVTVHRTLADPMVQFIMANTTARWVDVIEAFLQREQKYYFDKRGEYVDAEDYWVDKSDDYAVMKRAFA